MTVLVAVLIGSLFGTICMHGSFHNSSYGNDLWRFWWLFELAVSLTPFACKVVSRTVPTASSMALFMVVAIGSFYDTILHSRKFLVA